MIGEGFRGLIGKRPFRDVSSSLFNTGFATLFKPNCLKEGTAKLWRHTTVCEGIKGDLQCFRNIPQGERNRNKSKRVTKDQPSSTSKINVDNNTREVTDED